MNICTSLRAALLLVVIFGFFLAQNAVAQTTAPATDPQKEIQDLKAQVADLIQANQSLRAANDGLKKKIEALTNPPTASAPPRAMYQGSTFSKRAAAYISKTRNIAANDRAEALTDSAKIDKLIAAYVRKNSLSKDAESDLYSGQLKLGMTEEELKIIGYLRVDVETASEKTCVEIVWQPQGNSPAYGVTIEDGKVTAIDHTARTGFSSKEVHAGE